MRSSGCSGAGGATAVTRSRPHTFHKTGRGEPSRSGREATLSVRPQILLVNIHARTEGERDAACSPTAQEVKVVLSNLPAHRAEIGIAQRGGNRGFPAAAGMSAVGTAAKPDPTQPRELEMQEGWRADQRTGLRAEVVSAPHAPELVGLDAIPGGLLERLRINEAGSSIWGQTRLPYHPWASISTPCRRLGTNTDKIWTNNA